MKSVLQTSLLASAALASPILEQRQAAKGNFTFYPLPTPLSGICDLCVGPDGAIWYEDILVNKIGRLDPVTKEITDYSIPVTTPFTPANFTLPIPGVLQDVVDRTALSCAIRPGKDGNVYASNGIRNQLVRINPRTKKITVLAPPNNDPTGNLFNFNDIWSAKDGLYLTQTTSNTFQFYDFKTQNFTTYDVPTALSIPLGVFIASDKNVYIPELLGNKILEFNPITKAIAEYPLPAVLTPPQAVAGSGPAVMRAQLGHWAYFSMFQSGGTGRINIKTKKIELYPSDQAMGLGLGGVTANPTKAGNVIGTFFTANVISLLNGKTTTYQYIPFPDTFAEFDNGFTGLPGNVPPMVDVSAQYKRNENAIYFGSIVKNALGKYDCAPGE